MGQVIDCNQPGARRVPRGAKRRTEIAAVAEQAFLELGFAETTMQTIASRAGASKETLYRHFGSKEGLMAEIMQSRAERLTGTSDGQFQLNGGAQTVLFDMGFALLSFLSNPENCSWFRMIVTEAPRVPELAQIFFERGPLRILAQLTRFLATETEHGRLHCPRPELAAKMFFGSVSTCNHLATLMLIDKNPLSKAEIADHIREAVAMFLARYGSKA
jgi:AcrR family transcriptional regulator